MKSKVEYSTLSWVLTLGITAGLVIGLALTYNESEGFYILLGILVCMIVPSLFFAPTAISADEKEICIHSLLKKRSIPMTDIVSVERYRPLPGTIRTCASGGFMGYWGTFRDSVSKNYTGYWGRNADCFMVTLANGKKYLLGCKNPDAMLAHIRTQITN